MQLLVFNDTTETTAENTHPPHRVKTSCVNLL